MKRRKNFEVRTWPEPDICFWSQI